MARIRCIKPDFWHNDKVLECSPIARLLFIGMWNFADDTGRMRYSPKTMKAQIFPLDSIEVSDIARMLDELSSSGLIQVYRVEDSEYLWITGWHHQKIDRPQKSKYPPPPEGSSNIQRRVAPDLRGSKGNEGERIEKKDAADAAIIPFPEKQDSQSDRQKVNGEPPDVALYREGKELLGKSAGGMIRKLLAAKNGNIPLARAALLQASTKDNAREYIGGIIHGRDRDEMGALQPGYGDDFM